jgi:hypothetical protein
MNGQFVTSLRAVAASVAAGVVRGAGRLELETVALTSMNELKRPDVIGGKIRTVTNAQHGGILQFTVEQAHDTGLAFLTERGCGFVEKHPARFVQEEPRRRAALARRAKARCPSAPPCRAWRRDGRDRSDRVPVPHPHQGKRQRGSNSSGRCVMCRAADKGAAAGMPIVGPLDYWICI